MSRMGDLAATDVYSAFDVPLEQSTNVGWANRLGEILTTRPTYDESTIYQTASPLVNISEGDIGRATEAAMGVSGGGMKVETPRGIRAYHSSPHDFDKFDLAKIGTGEGAQVYGHGLYFAESPAVSGQGGQYWNQFLRHTSLPKHELEAAQILRNNNFDRAAAAQEVEGLVKHYDDKYSRDMLKVLQSGKPVGPRTYEVNINADPAHMLDWEKPLKGQSDEAVNALRSVMGDNWRDFRAADTSTAVKQGLIKYSPEATSAALREAGIPGIKYLDQGSRAPQWNVMPVAQGYGSSAKGPWAAKQAGKSDVNYFDSEAAAREFMAAENAKNATSNYVIFDPGIIDIMKKYGIAGAVPTAMGALAAQDQYRDQ